MCGILVEAKMSQLMGYLSETNFEQIAAVLARLGITSDMLIPFNAKDIVEAASGDKKNQGGNTYCILLKSIGEVEMQNGRVATVVAPEYIYQAFAALT